MKLKTLFFATILILMAFVMIVPTQPVHASPIPQQTIPWCGTTSEVQNYGFSMPLQQPHWTVNGESYVSQSAIDEVDALYDSLNNDNIANTMILFIDRNEVSNGSGCAGHFFFYMQLGNVDGPRMANGMAIIFIVTKTEGQITDVKVNYSVGGNLSALQPVDLMEMDIMAKDALALTGSLEEAYLTVMRYFEQYARSKYEPYYPPTQTPQPAGNAQPTVPTVNHLSFWDTLCLSLICFVGFLFFLWICSKLGLFSGTGHSSTTTNWSPTVGTHNNSRPTSSSRPHQSNSRPSSPPSRGGGGNKSGPTRVG